MANITIPVGYQRVMPYLILKGGEAFMDFMKNVFDATEKHLTMRDENLIMHAEIQIGESTIMFADATTEFTTQNAGLFVYMPHADETYSKAIAEGAMSISEMSDQPYGRSGGVKDPFGNVWWITSPVHNL
jgi:PhnB protein